MAQQSSNSWIWWTLGAVTLVGLGVGAYFIFRDDPNKPKDDEKKIDDTQDKGTNNVFSDLNLGSGSSVSGSSSSSTPSLGATPFKNQAEGDAFRLWVNTKYPSYAKEIDLDKSNSKYDNSTIRKAWAKYGAEYTADQNKGTQPQGLAQYIQQPSGADKNDLELGSQKINQGALVHSLERDSLNSVGDEHVYYMIDVSGIADWVVHIKDDGNIYFGEQTYGQDKNQNWGKWGYWTKPDGKTYWKVEMHNGKGNGTAENFGWLLKAVFKAQYPDIVAKYQKSGEWKDFSSEHYMAGLNFTGRKSLKLGSSDVLDTNL